MVNQIFGTTGEWDCSLLYPFQNTIWSHFIRGLHCWMPCIIQDKFWNTYVFLAKFFGIQIIAIFVHKVWLHWYFYIPLFQSCIKCDHSVCNNNIIIKLEEFWSSLHFVKVFCQWY
jgi:hypothetical protein